MKYNRVSCPMVWLKPSARVMICQRRALMVCARANRPTAASHSSKRREEKASPNLPQSVFQPTQPRRTELIPKRITRRMSLLTDQQLLFMGFRTQLVKPALLGIHHVNQDAIPPRDRKQGDHTGQVNDLSGRHLGVAEAPVVHGNTFLHRVANIDAQPESGAGSQPHMPDD